MQRDEEHVNMFDTPGPQHISNFPSMGDMSMFPMSAPATAPAFTTTKPFWDPDTHLTNVNVNNPAGHESLFGGTVSYRSSNSFDWGRDNQTFRQTDNISSFDPDISQDSKFRKSLTSGTQARPIATSTGLSFDFGGLMSHDPFAMANSMSGVDPGLLFTVPTDTSASMQRIRRGGDGQSLQGPERSYQQSFRDQEEFKRDGTMKDYSALTQHYKPAFSSSANPTRPGLQRSLSDSRTRRLSGQRSSHLSSTSLRLEPRALSRTGRTSPAKQVSRPSLASIPESAPRVRTEVKFIIDANGRARTDTTTIVDDPKTAIERSLSDDYDSSPSDSSTDDEPIMIPNRTSSLVLPAKRMDPRVSGFDTARRSIEGRRRSSSALGQSPRGSPSQLEEDSEAETVMEGDSGNAMHALRKVMDNRNRVKKRPGSTQPHLYSNTSPYQYASTNISPLTTTDPDLATPSTDRESSISDSTRCICGRRDGDVFMIQWYVFFLAKSQL
ncbi:MAG: hypothetical protein M1818_004628 [Claussenomyces sp. TS43310]|nr:MAG: hypothetical protein M1818_004628 [Claussenomyces sp. TS43310]